MKRRNQGNACQLLIMGMALLGVCWGCSTTQSPQSSTSTPPVSVTAAQTSESTTPAPASTVSSGHTVAGGPLSPYIPPPDRMDLCGEPVPLNHPDVAERFDREFTLIVYNHAQVYLWLKRMERFFPWVEERLRHYNLPEDLKYVAIVESDLLPNACSPKGAAGPWQFMPSTGASYGLEQRGSLDKRFDFERATDGAFRLLSDLNKRYKNWALAIAAYNCGDKRIMDEMRSQRVTDYYFLKLPQETERYVFRILAIKAVLGNAAQYGYVLPRGMGYQELKLDKVHVTLSSPVPIRTVAEAGGITFREFKTLNPVFRADDIPSGTQELKFPAGAGKVFEKNFCSGRLQTAAVSSEPGPQPVAARAQPEPAKSKPAAVRAEPVKSTPPVKQAPAKKEQAPAKKEKSHTVKKGDTLSGIAQKYSVSVQEIRKVNRIKGDDLAPGDKLRIP
ncbi:MAG: transglycosylase SLT domain-containing protein [Syntrophobacteraceae bacterium]|nr:transglycosylase SLT domain-containing protein [Desulfobacteraceae bacterium]